jgi:hypothetical protein
MDQTDELTVCGVAHRAKTYEQVPSRRRQDRARSEPDQKPKRRYLNMRKLGADHKEAAGFARTSKGYWRVAKHLGCKAGMTNEWLANEGLIDQLIAT